MTKRCTVAPTTYWSSVGNLLHFILLTTRSLRWFLEFWKIPAPLVWSGKRLREYILRSHQIRHGNVQQAYGISTVFTYVGFSSDGSGMHVGSSTFFALVSTAGGSTRCVAGDSSVKEPTNVSNVNFLFW